MNPHVRSVRALEDHELEVSFDNGESRRFDVKPYSIVAFLRASATTQRFGRYAGSVEWANGLDLSYDTLYVEGQPIVAPAAKAEQSNPADAR